MNLNLPSPCAKPICQRVLQRVNPTMNQWKHWSVSEVWNLRETLLWAWLQQALHFNMTQADRMTVGNSPAKWRRKYDGSDNPKWLSNRSPNQQQTIWYTWSYLGAGVLKLLKAAGPSLPSAAERLPNLRSSLLRWQRKLPVFFFFITRSWHQFATPGDEGSAMILLNEPMTNP